MTSRFCAGMSISTEGRTDPRAPDRQALLADGRATHDSRTRPAVGAARRMRYSGAIQPCGDARGLGVVMGLSGRNGDGRCRLAPTVKDHRGPPAAESSGATPEGQIGPRSTE